MSTQAVTDYLTKQIFIEKNIVTYRSLSREFSLNVNNAKNELATYHHNAPYQSLQCSAMFVISGVHARRMLQRQVETQTQDEDVDMDSTQNESTQTSGLSVKEAIVDEDVEEEDSDEVEEIAVTLVNEGDLEGAKSKYIDIHSIHVYSLAPAPLIDAGLVCDRTEQVRAVDRMKDTTWASTVGRLVSTDIKMGASKKGRPPVVAPAAGPSRLKHSGPSAPVISSTEPPAQGAKLTAAKTEGKIKTEPSVSTFYADKSKDKDKTKGSGKLNFFAKPKEATAISAVPEAAKEKEKDEDKGKKKEEALKKLKKEESTADVKNKMFFSSTKPAVATKEDKAPSPAPAKASSSDSQPAGIKIGPPRGVKRKPSTALNPNSREHTPDNPAIIKSKGKEKEQATVKTSDKSKEKAKESISKGARVRGNRIISDDEEEEMEAKPNLKKSRRAQSRASIKSYKSESEKSAVNSDAEREGRALMDMDDDQVERVSHAPSTVVSASDASFGEGGATASETDDNASILNVKAEDTDGDVDMDEETKPKPKPKQTRKRKAKAVIPVGQNGIKKRKVTKTRTIKNAKGYVVKEDYSDWESVEEGEQEAESEEKAPKIVQEKKEVQKKVKTAAPAPKKEKEQEGDDDESTLNQEKEKEKKDKKLEDKKKVEKDKPVRTKKPAGNVKTQKGMMMNFFKKS